MSYQIQNFSKGQTLTAEHLNNIEQGILSIEAECNNIFSDAPIGNKEVFTYELDTSYGDILDEKQSTSVQDPLTISTDTACIQLPTTYSATGVPTKLIFMNRGAGGDYTSSVNYTINKALLAAGFATLHVRGIPVSFQNSNYIQGVYGAPYGSPIWIRSAVAAYNYVINKYNIDRGGCATFGVSCGGLQSLNLANARVLPIVAVAIDAPVIDLHNDCYFGGGWITGSLKGYTAAGVAWMYQFDYCDWDNGTYTIDDTTYNFSAKDSTSLEALWQLNKKKVENYNAYESGKFIVELNDDEPVYGIKFPCPVKCWFGATETTNDITIARNFIERCRIGGSIAEMRTCPTSTHGVHQVTSDGTVTFNGLTISPYAVEEILWLTRWLGASSQNFLPDSDSVDNSVFNANDNVYLSADDGTLVSSDGSYKKVSDYIEIPDGATISEFGAIAATSLGNTAYCAFYDSNKTFISAVASKDGGTVITGTWKYTEDPPTIPSNAKYIRIAFNNGLSSYSDIELVKRDCAKLEFLTYS